MFRGVSNRSCAGRTAVFTRIFTPVFGPFRRGGGAIACLAKGTSGLARPSAGAKGGRGSAAKAHGSARHSSAGPV